ncbi:MAG: hypothetical protein Harvfovirus38_6 [Harvfovirus sp.]|uniref:Uncharacterized protein n=1 Tax=Harvfovirus sp. TaxID=2487768 RepID=A0A3G5A2R9_9VIRU|nr:MAG: hypothetical protein Harvfovirus38_6 [Harvfovirus sp.]
MTTDESFLECEIQLLKKQIAKLTPASAMFRLTALTAPGSLSQSFILAPIITDSNRIFLDTSILLPTTINITKPGKYNCFYHTNLFNDLSTETIGYTIVPTIDGQNITDLSNMAQFIGVDRSTTSYAGLIKIDTATIANPAKLTLKLIAASLNVTVNPGGNTITIETA